MHLKQFGELLNTMAITIISKGLKYQYKLQLLWNITLRCLWERMALTSLQKGHSKGRKQIPQLSEIKHLCVRKPQLACQDKRARYAYRWQIIMNRCNGARLKTSWKLGKGVFRFSIASVKHGEVDVSNKSIWVRSNITQASRCWELSLQRSLSNNKLDEKIGMERMAQPNKGMGRSERLQRQYPEWP